MPAHLVSAEVLCKDRRQIADDVRVLSSRMFMRFVCRHAKLPLAATIACSVVTVVGAAPAAIQTRRLVPRVTATVVNKGEAKTLLVRVMDKVSGKPIPHARVSASAEMRRPHIMIFPAMPLKEWRVPTARTRGDRATSLRTSSTEAGRWTRAAENV